MRSNRGLKASLLSLLLIIGSFAAFITPTVVADSTSGETTFYFVDVYDFGNYYDGSGYADLLGLTSVSHTPPTK